MKYIEINHYLEELELVLNVLPKKDRDNQILEVRDHLLQSIQEGNTEDEVLKSFLSPQELGKEIILEYQKLYKFSNDEGNELNLKEKNNFAKKIIITFIVIILLIIFLVLGTFLTNKNNSINESDDKIEYEEQKINE